MVFSFKHSLGQSSALLVASGFSLILTIIKFSAYWFSGSMLVLASCIDSLGDTCISLINHVIHNISREQADREHPFGHGGFEVIGSLLQGVILGFLGVWMALESIRILAQAHPEYLANKSVVGAIAILLGAALGGYMVQLYLDRQIKRLESQKQRSLTMIADRAHYSADAGMNLLSAIGMVLVYFTGYERLDALFGLLAAVFLIKSSLPVLRKCFSDIVQTHIPPELQQSIVDLVMSAHPEIKGVHALRSREVGPHLFLDFHLLLDGQMSLFQAHQIGDHVESVILAKYPNSDVLIHLDPDSEKFHEKWDPAYDLRLPSDNDF